MKKTLLSIFYIIFFATSAFSENKINPIYEGSPDAKIQLIIYESLTCSHCADFHKNVYPDLKENFIDKGYVKIEFRNFPLDMASLNASKIAHCKNDGKSDILHFLFENQEQWVKGSKCINDKKVEDHILEDRINAVKKFKLNATPTLIINNKKFDKPLNYKNLKKTLEKLI